jgi:hypothetical protein
MKKIPKPRQSPQYKGFPARGSSAAARAAPPETRRKKGKNLKAALRLAQKKKKI